MRCKAFLLSTLALCAASAQANAISWQTQMNCANDYYAYCSKFTAGSAGCHACMRSNARRLSNACVGALLNDGVISSADVVQPRTKITAAKTEVKPAPSAKLKPEARSAVRAPSSKLAAAPPAPQAASAVENAVEAEPHATLTAEPPSKNAPQQEPPATVLALDQKTYEAFKNRASRFVANAEFEVSAATAAR